MTTSPLRIAALIFHQFELLDLYGPLELFGMLEERASITVCALKAGIVESSQGPKGVADVPLSDVHAPDVFLVPGGWGTRREVTHDALLAEVRRISAECRLVAGVCTGAAILAKAGVLDGRRATTNKRAFDWVAQQGPAVAWVRRARWVEDGRYFTASGVSAGMDMSLAVIRHFFDQAEAENVARRAEYTWHRDSAVDPFAA